MAVIRANFLGGTITADISSGATSHTMAAWANLPAVVAPDVMYVTLGSEIPGLGGAPEIVKITAHTGGSTTITTMVRAQFGTSARAHLAVTLEQWRQAPLSSDATAVRVTPEMFGAGGLGVLDETAKVQAALDCLGGVAGELYLSGTYLVSVGALGSGHLRALTIYPNLKITGPGRLKLAASQGNYWAILAGATHATDLSNFTFEATIDCNGTNNLITGSGDLSGTQPRAAIVVYAGTNVSISKSQILDVGDVQNVLILNGDAITAGTCMLFDLKVKDNLISGVGRRLASAYATYGHDETSVYISATRYEVSGNTILGYSRGIGGAVTGMEMHGPGGSSHNNVIKDHVAGIYPTGQASFGSTSLHVHDNKISGARVGIEVWSLYLSPFTSGYAIDRVDIHDNDVEIDRDAWPTSYPSATTSPSYGILLYPDSDSPCRVVKIHHNHVTFLASSNGLAAADVADSGIYWNRTTAIYDEDVDITDNTWTGALSAGGHISANVKRLNYSRNTAVDPASSTGTFSDALRKGHVLEPHASGDITGWRINGNSTIDTRGTHKIFGGVEVYPTGGIGSCEAFDSFIYVFDGTAFPPFKENAGATSGTIATTLYGSASWDPPNITSGSVQSTAITVTGARFGDTVQASFNKDLAGLQIWGYVSANDTVAVFLKNDTGGAINPASGVARVVVDHR